MQSLELGGRELRSAQRGTCVSRTALPTSYAMGLSEDLLRRMPAVSQLPPCSLVYRNYWWHVVDGPGLVEEVHHFDDGSGPDPVFDVLTVSLMGWNFLSETTTGEPAPFPIWRAHCNVGEIPESRDYFLSVGLLDPEVANGAPGKPWTAYVQVGFYGWKCA